jgi:hypothetical protein
MMSVEEMAELALEEKKKEVDPARVMAIEVFKLLATHASADTKDVLNAVAMVLATIAVEMGMEEEKAVYAFRKSYGNAKRRLKRVMKEVH